MWTDCSGINLWEKQDGQIREHLKQVIEQDLPAHSSACRSLHSTRADTSRFMSNQRNFLMYRPTVKVHSPLLFRQQRTATTIITTRRTIPRNESTTASTTTHVLLLSALESFSVKSNGETLDYQRLKTSFPEYLPFLWDAIKCLVNI